MKQHLLKHLSIRSYECQVDGCGKMFKYAQHLTYHMTTHTTGEEQPKKVCTFEGCGKEFKSEWILKDHEKTHQNDYKFFCQYDGCSKKYNTRSNFEVHLRKHVGVRPYKCHLCQKKFISNWNKSKHMRLGKCEMKTSEKTTHDESDAEEDEMLI
jgi:uncharacterized Zn-finger protein